MIDKLTPEKSKAILYLLGGVVAIVILIVLFKKFGNFFENIFNFLTFTNPEKEKLKSEVGTSVDGEIGKGINSHWNPAYYRNAPAGVSIISNSAAEQIARQIYGSIDFVSFDDPEEALSAIKKCPNKISVSKVAEQFDKLYDKDLLTYMQYWFDTERQLKVLQQIIDYAQVLPNY